MAFTEVRFLLIFLPAALLCFYACPKPHRRFVLAAEGLVFYAAGCAGQPFALVLLLCSSAVTFAAGRMQSGKYAKAAFAAAMVWDIGWLFVYKYADFFIESFNILLSAAGLPEIPGLWPELPLGISFYTFQLLAYLWDVRSKSLAAEKRAGTFLAYICFFPKLLSGPLADYGELASQLKTPGPRGKQLTEGIRLFVIGLFLKVFLANQLANLWNDINAIGYESISVPLAWMGLLGYSLQLYFDFYGYSLMALGLGSMLGLRLPENFDCPYTALSVSEFWRRWHITLGTWFRKYVYIPLGGNREGSRRTLRNLLAVWLLTGLWHGAGWNFVLWGLLLFCLIAGEKLLWGSWLKSHAKAARAYVLLLMPLTWMVFAIDNMYGLKIYAGRLIGLFGDNVYAEDILKYGKLYWWLLLLGAFMATALPKRLYRRFGERKWFSAVLAAALGLSVFCLYKGMNDPFMYFRF